MFQKNTLILGIILSFPLIILGQSVHVLMPVYNSNSYLTQSLDSVLMQSYEKISLIVYNDGSTDGSQDILQKYKKHYPHKIILFGQKQNRGIAFARGALLEKSFKVDSDALILWLDSDDIFTDKHFIAKFTKQMIKTGADICLFSFDLLLEDRSQKSNLNGLDKEKIGHEKVLDTIWQSPNHTLPPAEIDQLMNVSTLGWTKGYSKIKWPKPLNCPYEDFVYMAALFNAKKITALPSSYRPIRYLRRKHSITGKRTAETFRAVIAQLTKFVDELSPENKQLHKKKISSFLDHKIMQYNSLLKRLVASEDHPDITDRTLSEYHLKASMLSKETNVPSVFSY